MFEKFTESSIKVVMLSLGEANLVGHNRVGSEQLLLGLIGEGKSGAAEVLTATGITLREARAGAKELSYLDSEYLPKWQQKVYAVLPFLQGDIRFTNRCQKAFALAQSETVREKDCLRPHYLLLGILDLGECRAIEILQQRNIDIYELRQATMRQLRADKTPITF